MYSFFIKEVSPEIKHSDQPQAIDPAQCTMLAAKRDSVQSVSPLLFQCGLACLEQDYLNITNVAMGKLCSQRFIDVLVQEHVVFTAYPAYLLDWKTKQTLTSSYFFWIPAWIEHAIDWERSEETLNPETGVRYLTKLVVTTECEKKAPLLFQAKERASILVHNRLRQQLEATGMRERNKLCST